MSISPPVIGAVPAQRNIEIYPGGWEELGLILANDWTSYALQLLVFATSDTSAPPSITITQASGRITNQAFAGNTIAVIGNVAPAEETSIRAMPYPTFELRAVTIPAAPQPTILVRGRILMLAPDDRSRATNDGVIQVFIPGPGVQNASPVQGTVWSLLRSQVANASLPISSGQTVISTGYNVVGDYGNGARYRWDGASTETADGATVLAVASTGGGPGRFKLLIDDGIDPAWFGAQGDGVIDDTLPLRAMFEFAMPRGVKMNLKGRTYQISDTLTRTAYPDSSRAPGDRVDGDLHIDCGGDAVINVIAGSPFFDNVIISATDNISSSLVTNGSLTIDCANRARVGLRTDNRGGGAFANLGGLALLENLVTLNVYGHGANGNYSAAGITVLGSFKNIILNNPGVENVNRNAVGGALGTCAGILITRVRGVVEINSPKVRKILAGGFDTDADGISIFGEPANGDFITFQNRLGKCTISNGVFEDCQGRSVKSQMTDTTVLQPQVLRQSVVSISNGVEFAFQYGGGLLIEPRITYKRNGVVSPIGSSFSVFNFAGRNVDAPTTGRVVGGAIYSEVAIPRLLLAESQAGAQSHSIEVDGLKGYALSPLAVSMFSRGLIEFNASQYEALTTFQKATLICKNTTLPSNTPIFVSTSYGGTNLGLKMGWVAHNNIIDGIARGSSSKVYAPASGSSITRIDDLRVSGNSHTAFMPLGWWVNFTVGALPPNTDFSYLRDNATRAITGDIAVGSPLVINTNTDILIAGAPIAGTGIPAAATILSIDSPTQLTLSANATANTAGLAITVTTVVAAPSAARAVGTHRVRMGQPSNTNGTWVPTELFDQDLAAANTYFYRLVSAWAAIR